MTTTTRAAIYARVSSADQVQGTSLDTQQERCEAYAAAQGWEVVGHYVDEGVSGAKASRPALDRLLADVRSGRVGAVIVAKLDRLGRSMRHLSPLIGELDDQGVALVSVADNFDSSTPSGRMVRNMLGSVAEFERDLIRERTLAGRAARVRDGGWGGGDWAPYGYRVAGAGRDAHLEVDPGEAATIRQAVTFVLDHGLTTGQAAVRLNALGMTPRKVPTWTAWNLRTCLGRGQWGGTWTWGKPGQQSVPQPITQAVEPILDPERFAALRAWLDATASSRGNRGEHPLSGRLLCACGATMYGMSRAGRKRRYHCSHAKPDPRRTGTCDQPTVLADAADDAVWGEVVGLLADPDRLMAMARERLGMLHDAQEVTADALGDADAAVDRAQAALSRAVARCIALGLDDATTAATVAHLRAEHLAAVEHRQTVAAIRQEATRARERMTTAQRLAEVARDRLVSADATLRAKVLGLLDVRAQIVSHDGRDIHLRVTGSVAHDLLLEGLAPTALATGSP